MMQKWKCRNAIWYAKAKPKKTEMLKSQEYSNCHEPLSQEQMNWGVSNIQTTTNIKPSILEVAYFITHLN